MNLSSLNLSRNNRITDEGIRGLLNLRSLDLSSNDVISDEGIQGLTKLTILSLSQNDKITAQGVFEMLHCLNFNIGAKSFCSIGNLVQGMSDTFILALMNIFLTQVLVASVTNKVITDSEESDIRSFWKMCLGQLEDLIRILRDENQSLREKYDASIDENSED
jgi:hypothetical protein